MLSLRTSVAVYRYKIFTIYIYIYIYINNLKVAGNIRIYSYIFNHSVMLYPVF